MRIYDVTPDAVHEGYTPGYLGTAVSDAGTVVYGTGYAYPSWIGDAWYPAPATYGVAAMPIYNRNAGFTFAFAVGLATPAWTQPYWGNDYYHPGYWGGYPCCATVAANVYAGPRQRDSGEQATRALAQWPAARRRACWRHAAAGARVATRFAPEQCLCRCERQCLPAERQEVAAAIAKRLGQCLERRVLGRPGVAGTSERGRGGGELRDEQHDAVQRRARHGWSARDSGDGGYSRTLGGSGGISAEYDNYWNGIQDKRCMWNDGLYGGGNIWYSGIGWSSRFPVY